MREKNDELKPVAVNCGPECACGTSGGGSRKKWIICGAVALAAVVVVAVRLSNAAAAKSQAPPRDYAAAVSVVTGPDAAKPASSADSETWALPLKTLAELNKVAADTEAVFVVLPSKDENRMATILREVSAAAATIGARGSRMGRFLLSWDSPEYAALVSQVGSPAVLAFSKGGGMAAVRDEEVGQGNLLKAFVASSRPSGCGPRSCGPVGCR